MVNGAKFLNADNKDFDQTTLKMLTCDFVGRTCQKVRFYPLRFISVGCFLICACCVPGLRTGICYLIFSSFFHNGNTRQEDL